MRVEKGLRVLGPWCVREGQGWLERIEEGQGVLKNAKEYWREPGRVKEGQDTFTVPYVIKS